MLNPHVLDAATPQHVHVSVGREISPVHVLPPLLVPRFIMGGTEGGSIEVGSGETHDG